MLSFGANVIIWCYHVMLSSGMITSPYIIFPENFTHSDGRGGDKNGGRALVSLNSDTTHISAEMSCGFCFVEDYNYLYNN